MGVLNKIIIQENGYPLPLLGFPGGSEGKESAVWETRVRFLGFKDSLEKGMATDFLPGEFQGQRSLVGSSPRGCKELDVNWVTNTFTFIFNMIRSVPVRKKVFNKVIIFPLLSYLPILTSLVQFSSVAQLCLTPCDSMACSTPGFPVHHQLLELAQTHVH